MSIPEKMRNPICNLVKRFKSEDPEFAVYIIRIVKEYEDKANRTLQKYPNFGRKE